MEGVLVSGKKDGASITTTVATDAQGRYSFLAGRIEPGKYAISIRAVGYKLDGPKTVDVPTGTTATVDLQLSKVKNLVPQLSNGEWLLSLPGADKQKAFLTLCVGCHTLQRVLTSNHDAAEFEQVFLRMARYSPGSTPTHPQPLLPGPRGERPAVTGEAAKAAEEFLASVSLGNSEAAEYPLKTLPRPKGRSTKVVITEYDLPRRNALPHDVSVFPFPGDWISPSAQASMVSPRHSNVDGKVWTNNQEDHSSYRLDLASGKFENLGPAKTPDGKQIRAYGMPSDQQNNLYQLEFGDGHIGRRDAKTREVTVWLTSGALTRPRRGRVDEQNRLWFAEY